MSKFAKTIRRPEDGRSPVAMALLCHRQDPGRPGVINYRGSSAFVFALNADEANGIGQRMGRELWPPEDGWNGIDIALYWLAPSECAEIAAAAVSIVTTAPDGA